MSNSNVPPPRRKSPAGNSEERPDFAPARLFSQLLIVSSFAYALYAIRMLWFYRQTTVHADFWIIYDQLLTRPFPANILTPLNSHSLIFPALIWLANFWLFRGSEVSHYVLTLILLGVVATLLIWLGLKDRRASHSERAMIVASSLLATFWLAKAGILTSAGFAVTCSLPMIGLLLGVYAVTGTGQGENSSPNWKIAISGCVLATFSFATGLAAWPALGMLTWLRHRNWRASAVFVGGTLICTVLIIKILPMWIPEKPDASPISIVESFPHWLKLLGSPVANVWAGISGQEINPALGLVAGGLGAGLMLACLFRISRRKVALTQAQWTGAALVLFIACAAGLIALGRLHFFRAFKQDMFSSRYLYWMAFFWLGLLWLLAGTIVRWRRWRQIGLWTVTAAGLIVVPASEPRVLKDFADKRGQNEILAASLAAGVPVRGKYLVFIQPEAVLGLDQTLREKKLCYYARPAYAAMGQPLSTTFSILPGRELAKFEKNSTYGTMHKGQHGLKVSGQLADRPADFILLTDEQDVVRGLGCFSGEWEPFSGKNRSSFSAFAPVLSKGKSYRVWATRGHFCRLVISDS